MFFGVSEAFKRRFAREFAYLIRPECLLAYARVLQGLYAYAQGRAGIIADRMHKRPLVIIDEEPADVGVFEVGYLIEELDVSGKRLGGTASQLPLPLYL